MASPSDTELVGRCVGGDEGAFEELVRRHWIEVIGLAARWLGRDGAEAAEDVAVDAFVALHRELPRWRREASVMTWLHRATFNLCGNRIQARRRRRHASQHMAAAKRSGGAEVPERAVVTSERSRRLKRALSRLPERERQAVILFHYQGLAPARIAEVLGVSVSTAKRALRGAMARLKGDLLPERERIARSPTPEPSRALTDTREVAPA